MFDRKVRHQVGRVFANPSMAPKGRLGLIVAVLLILLSVTASAQIYSGSVTGVVADPSAAVVPGANITLIDQDKGFKFVATADASGHYLVRSVPPGTYRIFVEASGFSAQSRPGVVVGVNQNVSVDFLMELGATSQAIEVSAS